MDDKKLRKLYQNGLKHFSLPDFETFKSDMKDPSKLSKFRNNMSKYYTLPDVATMQSDLGLISPPKKKETSVSDGEPEKPTVSSDTKDQKATQPSVTSDFPKSKGRAKQQKQGVTRRAAGHEGAELMPGKSKYSGVVEEGLFKQGSKEFRIDDEGNWQSRKSYTTPSSMDVSSMDEPEILRKAKASKETVKKTEWSTVTDTEELKRLDHKFTGEKTKDPDYEKKSKERGELLKINSRFMTKSESEMVEDLRNSIFGQDFNFEETGFGNQIKVTTKDGEHSQDFYVGHRSLPSSLLFAHSSRGGGAEVQARKLRNFLRENSFSDELNREMSEASLRSKEMERDLYQNRERVNQERLSEAEQTMIDLGLPEYLAKGEVKDVTLGVLPEYFSAGTDQLRERGEAAIKDYKTQYEYLSTKVSPDKSKDQVADELRASIGTIKSSSIQSFNENAAYFMEDIQKTVSVSSKRMDELNKEASDIKYDIAQSGGVVTEEQQTRLEEIQGEADSISENLEGLDYDLTELNELQSDLAETAGIIALQKEEEGNIIGGVWNNFVTGVMYAPRLMGIVDKSDVESIVNAIGDDVVTEEWESSKDRSDIEKVALSLAESIGVSVSSALTGPAAPFTSAIGFFGQSYYQMMDEMNENPEMRGIPDSDKQIMSSLFGLTAGMLERYGITKGFSKSPVGKKIPMWIMKNVFRRLPKNATQDVIELEIKRDIKKLISSKVINIAGASLQEGATELAQEIDQIAIQEVYDAIQGTDYFDNGNPDDIKARLWESSKLGIYGGGMMSTMGQAKTLLTEKWKDQGISNDLAKMLQKVSADADFRSTQINYLKSKIVKGEMTAQEAKDAMIAYDEVMSNLNKIPENIEDVTTAYDLITEKQKLESEILNKEKSLVVDKQQRIDEINNELQTLTDAVQEPAAEKVDVQEQATVSETVGEKDAEIETVTEEGAEEKIIPTNIADKKGSYFGYDVEGKVIRGSENRPEGGRAYLQGGVKNVSPSELWKFRHVREGSSLYDNLPDFGGDLNKRTDEETREYINSLKEDIKKNGIKEPVRLEFDDNGYAFLGEGNHRLVAAMELEQEGYSISLPVETKYHRFNVSNRVPRPARLFSKEQIDEARELSDKQGYHFNYLSPHESQLKEGAEVDVLPQETKETVSEAEQKSTTQPTTTTEQIQELKDKHIDDDRKLDALEAARKVLKAVPNAKVVVHETTESYQEALSQSLGRTKESIVEEEAEGVTYGSFTSDGTVHIDLTGADAKTVFHEAFHAVFSEIGLTEGHAVEMVKDLKSAVKDKTLLSKMDDFVKAYEAGEQSEEFLAELVGDLANEAKTMDTTRLQKLINIINKIASKLGLPSVLSKSASRQETVDFINGISKALTQARPVSDVNAETIIKKVDNKESVENTYVETNGEVTPTKSGRKMRLVNTVVSESDVIDPATLEGKPLEVVYYDNYTSSNYQLTNRVSGSSVSRKGEGGPGYSFRPEIKEAGIIAAFTTVTKGLNLIQGIRSRNKVAGESAVIGVALQNKETGHLGNKNTLNDFFNDKDGEIARAVSDGIISEVKAVSMLKDAVKAYESTKKGKSKSSSLGFTSNDFNSLSDFFKLMDGISFERRGTFNQIIIPTKSDLKITKSTKPHVKTWLKAGIPTLADYYSATTEAYTTEAESHDIVKYLSPNLDKVGVSSKVEVTEAEKSRAKDMGVEIVTVDDALSHTSYPVTLFGENLGVPSTFHSVRDMASDWDVPNPFFQAGRRKDTAEAVRIPKLDKKDKAPKTQPSRKKQLSDRERQVAGSAIEQTDKLRKLIPENIQQKSQIITGRRDQAYIEYRGKQVPVDEYKANRTDLEAVSIYLFQDRYNKLNEDQRTQVDVWADEFLAGTVNDSVNDDISVIYKLPDGNFIQDFFTGDLFEAAEEARRRRMITIPTSRKKQVSGDGKKKAIDDAKAKYDLSKKRGNSEAQAIESAIADLQKNDWYVQSSDIEQNAAVKELKKALGVKPGKAAPSLQKLGLKPKDKEVLVNERVALREKIIAEARAAMGGAKFEKTERKALFDKINAEVLKIKGIVSGKELKTVIKRALTMNLSNPVMADRFADYIVKLAADAEYGAKLKLAHEKRSKIKTKLNGKDIQKNNKSIAVKFRTLDPKYSQDIDLYIENSEKILESLDKTGVRSGKLNVKQQPKLDQIAEFIDESLEFQNKVKMDMIELSHPELFESGALSRDMTPSEAMLIIEGVDLERTDKTISDEKLKEIEDRLYNYTDSLSGYLSEMINKKVDPMTGEEITIPDLDVKTLKSLASVDQKKLTLNELFRFTDLLQNAVVNMETSSVATFVEKINGRIAADRMYSKYGKIDAKGSITSKVISPASGVNVTFSQVLGGVNTSTLFQVDSGFDDIRTGKAKATTKARKTVDEYDSKFKKKKPNNESFDSVKNRVEREMYARLIRSINGSKVEAQKEFARRLRIVRQSVEAYELEYADDVMKAKANTVREVADKLGIFENGVVIEDIVSRVDPTNADAVSFWIDKFGENFDKSHEVSSSVYGKELPSDFNYTPDVMKRIKGVSSKSLDETIEKAYNGGFSGKYDMESGSLMSSSRPNSIPSQKVGSERQITMYINFDFDSNVSNAFHNLMIDIETAKPIRKFQGFIQSDSFSKMVSNRKNRDLLIKTSERYIRFTRGVHLGKDDIVMNKKIMKVLFSSVNIGASVLLGNIDQILKQSASMIANTTLNSFYIGMNEGKFGASIGGAYLLNGKDMGFKFSLTPPLLLTATKEVKNWMIDGGVDTKIFRGIESMGTIDSKGLKSKAETMLDKGIDAVEFLPKKYVELFLVNGDKMVANSAFLMYYKKYMIKNGKSPVIDFGKPMDQKAKVYAQIQVAKQQGESDSDMNSALYSKDAPTLQKSTVKLLLPLSSFILNKKSSIVSDLSILFRKNARAEDKAAAVQSITSSLVEISAYSAISVTLRVMIINAIANSISGYDEAEEDPFINKEVKLENKRRGTPMSEKEEREFRLNKLAEKKSREQVGEIYTNLIKDLNPLPPIFDYYLLSKIDEWRKKYQENSMADEIEKAIKEKEKIDEKEMSDREKTSFTQEYLEDKATRLMIFDNDGLGSFSFIIEQTKDDYDLVKMAIDGKFKDKNGRYKYLTDEQKEIAQDLAIWALPLSKAIPSEGRRITMKAARQLRKMALTAKQMDEYEKVKKEFGSVSKEQLKEIKNKSGGSNKKKKKRMVSIFN